MIAGVDVVRGVGVGGARWPRARHTAAASVPLALLLMLVAGIDREAGRILWYATALATLGAMAALDLRTRRVRNAIVYPALVAAAMVPVAFGTSELVVALQGGLLGFGLMLALAVVGHGAMGMADVKVMALCGLLLGPGLVIAALALASIAGAAVALVLIILRRAGRKDSLPLVPFLAAATVVLLLTQGGAV